MESPEGGALFLGKPSLRVSGGEQTKWLQTRCTISLPTPPDPASSPTGRRYGRESWWQRKVRVWVRAEVGCGWNLLPRCLNFHID
ncbi:hypothetical protein AAG906_018673 [Vitis piasezkii]